MLSLDHIEWLVNDYERRQHGVVWTDGRQVWEPFASGEPGVDSIARSIFSPQYWWTFHHTTGGHMVISETYSPVPADPLKGRPTVYLDQMHWRTLADVFNGKSSNVRRVAEIAPAQNLMTRVTDGQVLLPVSAGTISETTSLYDSRRYEAGVAVAKLSYGWQVRHALAVRAAEVLSAVAEQLGLDPKPPPAVVTLRPGAVLGLDKAEPVENLGYLTECITWSGTLVRLLIDPEKIGKDTSKAELWVAAMQTNSSKLNEDNTLTVSEKARIAHALVWHDLRGDIERAVSAVGAQAKQMRALDLDALRDACPSIRIYAHWADSTGRRNTLTSEVVRCGDQGLVRESERCSQG